MDRKSTNSQGLGLAELIDKDLQTGMLNAALGRDRLGGTLLFFGPDGSGKSSLAFWLAQALNCLENRGKQGPCAACDSCRKVAGLNHPDVIWTFPLPGSFYNGEHIDQARLAEVYEEKRSSPWLDIQFTEKSEHHLAAIHSIRAEAAKSSYEGRRKVFIITGADRLRIEASNAFLKLLEEPRRDVTLILCTDRPSSLIPTILSRCQRLQITRPGVSISRT
ncbi:MAG: AAA family ATPase, partial [Gemmatimonadota bacterium]|nr:AAA family ATPase [Gemmatimonadota bacterium]